MSAIETNVLQRILDVSALPGSINQIDKTKALSALGFNDVMCADLAQRLNTYVKTIKPAAYVNNAEIASDKTVQDVIDLINEKTKP